MSASLPSESFISFIWQHQKFNNFTFRTTIGETVIIKKTGFLNTNSGPDFQEASIYIDDVRWDGCIELHVKSSERYEHNHHLDATYENVILHVVWKNDVSVYRKDNTEIPALEINNLVDAKLIENYQQLLSGFNEIPCFQHLPTIDPFHIKLQLDRAGIERLKIKAETVKSLLVEHKNDWEEVTYILLAKNFGFKLNSAPFELLARSLPYKLIRQNRHSPKNIDMLIFGMSSLFNYGKVDAYSMDLTNEFKYLQNKYSLSPRLTGTEWKFMRTRPDNFPTHRLAQFSALLFKIENLFSLMIQNFSVKDYTEIFKAEVSDYWKTHYMINKLKTVSMGYLGQSSIENIIINTIAPIRVAYGIEIDAHEIIESGVDLLESIQPESNKFTRKMKAFGFPLESALKSQAAIHQYQNYCLKSKCLSCDIGHKILKRLE